ncbi:hypothetical protein BC938DRAFT_472899 [Jimgerdemannia flammicorona]|uniref:Galactose oxidase n=1 Tax=Jimgerdemannia flammicorona TaxID=994334 RepID=A0A433Q569_9FUNG|nr:hypothetical protein BC938DRAFT_472899 [Jimgerdemannia flammicorona]
MHVLLEKSVSVFLLASFAVVASAAAPPGLIYGRYYRHSLLEPLFLNPFLTCVISLPDSTAVINSVLYFLGGQGPDGNSSAAFYAVDLTAPFPAASPPWKLLDSNAVTPADSAASFVHNGTFWRQGGLNRRAISPPPQRLELYNPTTSAWSFPTVGIQAGSKTPLQSCDHSVVLNEPTGIAYFFGGQNVTGGAGGIELNVLYTLDTNTLLFADVNPTGTPPPPVSYHQAILIDGNMYVLGGKSTASNGTIIRNAFDQISVYNTLLNSWSVINTTGQIPTPRSSHTAVLLPNGISILVFGGNSATANNDIYVLHTTNMTWSAPTFSGTAPVPRIGHSAVMVGTQMLVMMGYIDANYVSDFHVLDTDKWEWTTGFTPTNVRANASNPSNPSSLTFGTVTTTAIVTAQPNPSSPSSNPLAPVGGPGGVAAMVLGAIILVIIGVTLCRRYRRAITPDSQPNVPLKPDAKPDIVLLPMIMVYKPDEVVIKNPDVVRQ